MAGKRASKAVAAKSAVGSKMRKPLRIREELLPESAVYGTFAGKEYVMIPVEDFGDWYEDLSDNIAADCAMEEPGISTPMEKVFMELDRRKGRK